MKTLVAALCILVLSLTSSAQARQYPQVMKQYGDLWEVPLGDTDPVIQAAMNGTNAHFGTNGKWKLSNILRSEVKLGSPDAYTVVLNVTRDGQNQKCTLTVKPSQDSFSSGTPKCTENFQTEQMGNGMMGAPVPSSIQDKETKEALFVGEEEMNKRKSVDEVPRKVIAVRKVSSQLVAGLLYKFEDVVMENPGQHDVKICDMNIWIQAWMTPKVRSVNLDCKKNKAVISA